MFLWKSSIYTVQSRSSNSSHRTMYYILNLISKSQQTMTTRNNHIPKYPWRTDCFKYSLFPSTLRDWFNLNASIRNSESPAIFKSRLLSFIRPIQSNVYNIFDPIGLELLTRLRLGCSHLTDIVRTPYFFKGGELNFNYLPRRGESEKSKKMGGSMVQEQVFLKGGLALILFNFFKVYYFYI